MSTILLVITNCFCEAHASLSVKVSFWSDIQIPVCREGSEEAGKCPGKAHGAIGGGSNCPPLGKTWHPTPEGECCHSGQQGAQLPWWSSWWDSLNCTTAKTICNYQVGTVNTMLFCTISDTHYGVQNWNTLPQLNTPHSPKIIIRRLIIGLNLFHREQLFLIRTFKS